MIFFKRKKKEKALEERFDELNGGAPDWEETGDSPGEKSAEHDVIERLEQMIEVTKELEDEKAEYRVVTSYLNDIQTIENLSDDEKKTLSDIAQNIVALNRTRDELVHTEKKIADTQFRQMQQEEAQIPNAIKRLKANEAYLETVKRDMKYLEREKEGSRMNMEMCEFEQRKMQKYMYVNMGIAVTTAVVFAMLQFLFGADMGLWWMALIFAAVVAISVPYLKMLSENAAQRRAKANESRAVALLNKVKIKYVNMTNAVDYACEKYHVRSAAELEYVWNCYMDAVRQKEKFAQNSDDLDYFNSRLVRELSQYRLYDSRVWVPQAAALADHREMVEITHNLIARRQKLRARMEYNRKTVNAQKAEVAKMMDDMPQMKPQIADILESVNRLNGS